MPYGKFPVPACQAAGRAAMNATRPAISRAKRYGIPCLYKSSLSCTADIISPYEIRPLFLHFGKGIPHISKNLPLARILT